MGKALINSNLRPFFVHFKLMSLQNKSVLFIADKITENRFRISYRSKFI